MSSVTKPYPTDLLTVSAAAVNRKLLLRPTLVMLLGYLRQRRLLRTKVKRKHKFWVRKILVYLVFASSMMIPRV